MTAETKTCTTCDARFIIESEDVAILKQLDIPHPGECTFCVWQRLLAFWVFGKFRKTKSALSGKTIITTFGEGVRFPIYDRTEWVSDAWDPLTYGRDYDFSRSFFEQFKELRDAVPHPHQSGTQNTNCDWCDDVWESKNCYLIRSLLRCEDLNYGYRNFRCKNSTDIVFCFDSDSCYDCLYCFKCYKVQHSFDARDSLESDFLYDCRNVQNCFMCWNLRSKQYHILNKPYSREAYFEELKRYNLRSRKSIEGLKKEFKQLVAKEAIHRENYNVKVTNSSGNFLEECKNCHFCYFLQISENTRHTFRGLSIKDSIYSIGTIAEKSAYSIVDLYNYETVATLHCDQCRYSSYLDYCEECEYCFGCVGLRKKKYCILNKQYTEAEYKALLPKIKEHMLATGDWGKFFPYSTAYGGYNLSITNSYFPATKEEVKKLGAIWEEPSETAAEGVRGDTLPDTIDEVSDGICTKPIICPKTGWRFNIAPQELRFYKANGIPLPQNHFDTRILELFKPLTVIKSFQGKCYRCGKSVTHFYPPEWGYQKIACENCYHAQVQ
ncbi:hypothetical protein C4571_03610 [Candidatus Parcubacteria bacterium]|nr:MAG: hypothetical protein C4571_03610 [Candidatus Parcubacteria bacterium]